MRSFLLLNVKYTFTFTIPVYKSSLTIFSRNRDRKEELEHDWSDKKQADEIDTFCVGLRNENTYKQFYGAAAKFQEVLVLPIYLILFNSHQFSSIFTNHFMT